MNSRTPASFPLKNFLCIAAACLVSAIKSVSAESFDQLTTSAFDAYKSQKYSEALGCFNRAMETETNLWVVVGRAATYLKLNEFKRAEEDYDHTILLSTNSEQLSRAYHCRSALYVQMTNYDKAIEDLSKAVQINPAFYEAYASRASVYNSMGRYDAAIADCNMATLLNAEDAFAHQTKGSAYLQKGNNEKAIGALSEAIRINTNDAWSFGIRAMTYFDMDNYTNTVKDLNDTIRLKPNSDAYASRGLARSKVGDFKGGIEDCQKAVLLNSNNPTALNNLAWLLATAPKAKIRNGKKAVELAVRACELTDWHQPYCLGTLAAAHAETGNFEEAIKWENKCIVIGLREKDMIQARKELRLFQNKKPYHADE